MDNKVGYRTIVMDITHNQPLYHTIQAWHTASPVYCLSTLAHHFKDTHYPPDKNRLRVRVLLYNEIWIRRLTPHQLGIGENDIIQVLLHTHSCEKDKEYKSQGGADDKGDSGIT